MRVPEYLACETFTDYAIFDADQHVYEAWDCVERYIPDEYAERTIRLVENGDETVQLIGDGKKIQLDWFDRNRIVRPGSLKEVLKSIKGGGSETGDYEFMDMDPAFQDASARLELMDSQSVEAAVLFPGHFGLLAEFSLEDDDVYYATSWAYLRYVEEEWGFSRDDRLLYCPIVSLRDVDRTCEQLDWMIERGLRVVGMLPGPAYGRSPADRHFDPFWARLDEAGVVAAYHINEAVPGYKAIRSGQWGEEEHPTFLTQSAWQWMWAYGEQPALETFTSLIYGNLFERFPNVHILSAEHGCEWAPSFARRLDKMRGMGRNGRWQNGPLPERPSEIFKRHFRVVPFWEDDVEPVIDALGKEVILGGSDFPHPEGLAYPTQLVEHIPSLSHADQKFIMRDSGMALFGLE